MRVLEYLERNECYGRFVSIDHLEGLRDEVRGLHNQGIGVLKESLLPAGAHPEGHVAESVIGGAVDR